jgi:hypothetical protein
MYSFGLGVAVATKRYDAFALFTGIERLAVAGEQRHELAERLRAAEAAQHGASSRLAANTRGSSFPSRTVS